MPEQIICNIVRPEVGIGYTAETPDAGLTDRLAAAELSLVSLAEHIRQMRATLGLPCPQIVVDLAGSKCMHLAQTPLPTGTPPRLIKERLKHKPGLWQNGM